MRDLNKSFIVNETDLEQRFVGFVESIRRKIHFSNHLVSHSYCPYCQEYVLAEIQGGISDDKGIKNLYCNCPKCYNSIILKRKREVGH